MYQLPVEKSVVCGPPTKKELSQCVPNSRSATSKLSNAGQMKLYQKQQNYKNQPINLSIYYGPVAGSVTKNTLMANGNSSGGHSRNSKRVNTL